MPGLHDSSNRLYRYYPEDFGVLPIRVIHMDLLFDIHDDHTRVSSHLAAEVLDQPVSRIALNANDLEIDSVSCDVREVTSEYDRERSLLTITCDPPLPQGARFTISTVTVCRPSNHILEGLYYDHTPPGAPPTQITQCQQWGFQRLVPCIDEMAVKCTYTTTIIADSRYTRIISNGDISEARHSMGNGRDRITYDNSRTPMAPYLFFLCVGTYDTFSREFEYPDGDTFGLELLVPPGSGREEAGFALQVLADAIMWVHLFTGPSGSHRTDEKIKLLSLIHERDALKAQGGANEHLMEIRKKIWDRSVDLASGYRYTGTVYREIGMQNSDFGGMENVGNTTIIMNRIMPTPQMTDPAFEYMIKVKVHEFYHNLNGSEVTGRSPFEIWLNEAVTVFIEEDYHGFLFGDAYTRLQTVLTLFAPSTGTFALDSGSMSMPIEPDGFNDPNDLITGITYVKAAEFVRMIQILMGKDLFARGLDRYHTRYRHTTATWQQWIRAMEEVSGQSFMGMARTWLKQTGFPTLTVEWRYDKETRTFELSLVQTYPEDGEPWTFPFEAALVDAEGNDLATVHERLDSQDSTITLEDVAEPAFVSLNRGFSFYGRVRDTAGAPALGLQARKDPDPINRFIAVYRLAEQELIRLIEDPEKLPSESFIALYHTLLTDEYLAHEAGGLHLTLFEGVDDPRYAHRYTALHRAMRRLERAIAGRYMAELQDLYQKNNRFVPVTAPLDLQIPAIRERNVKNVCLGLLASLDTRDVHGMLRAQATGRGPATDRYRAFGLYLDSSAPDRLEVLASFARDAALHPVSWEACLAAIGGCSADDAIALVRQAEALPSFTLTQVNDHRALYGAFAANRKISLETAGGREHLGEVLVRLAPVNQNSTVALLRNFGALDLMEPEFRVPLVALLVSVRDALDPVGHSVIHHTIRKLLSGAPLAVGAYANERGSPWE